jgi:hypothetical protein
MVWKIAENQTARPVNAGQRPVKTVDAARSFRSG